MGYHSFKRMETLATANASDFISQVSRLSFLRNTEGPPLWRMNTGLKVWVIIGSGQWEDCVLSSKCICHLSCTCSHTRVWDSSKEWVWMEHNTQPPRHVLWLNVFSNMGKCTLRPQLWPSTHTFQDCCLGFRLVTDLAGVWKLFSIKDCLDICNIICRLSKMINLKKGPAIDL